MLIGNQSPKSIEMLTTLIQKGLFPVRVVSKQSTCQDSMVGPYYRETVI